MLRRISPSGTPRTTMFGRNLNPQTNLLLSAMCLIGMQGCAQIHRRTDQSSIGHQDSSLLLQGTWYKEEYVFRGSEARLNPIKYEFFADGHFRYYESEPNGDIHKGTWRLSGTQLEQMWNGTNGLEGKTKRSIFLLTNSRLDLENLKKGRDTFYRHPKFRYVPAGILD